jgi:hypothetical protein
MTETTIPLAELLVKAGDADFLRSAAEASPSVPMTMRHLSHASLNLGAGERHRGYAQHAWTNEHRRW